MADPTIVKTSELPEIIDNLPVDSNASLVGVVSGSTVRFRIKTIKGVLELTKADVGLDKVDNTPDLKKPISEDMARALSNKASATHTHTAGSIENLREAIVSILSEQSPTEFQISDIVGLVDALETFASKHHNHSSDDINVTIGDSEINLTAVLSNKLDKDHEFTIDEVTGLRDVLTQLSTIATDSITKTQLNDILLGYSKTNHKHTESDIDGGVSKLVLTVDTWE